MKTKTILAEMIAAAMIAAPLSQPASVFNVHALDTTPAVQADYEAPVLQDATVIIPSQASEEQVNEILNQALIKNKDSVDLSNIHWEYQCEGKNGLLTNTAWGSVNGFTSTKKVVITNTTFTHPSLAQNKDGSYQVRIQGTDSAVTLTKAAKLQSHIECNEGVQIAMPYKDATTIDYDALKELIFNKVVKNSTPEVKLEDVSIKYKATMGWSELEGESLKPAITVGTHQIQISYNGNEEYYGTSSEVNVTFIERPETDITLKENQTIKLSYNDDMSVNYDEVKKEIFNKTVESSNVNLTSDDVTIQYYATGKLGTSSWVDLKGGTVNLVNYPAISEGDQKIRIIYAGDKDHAAKTVETTIHVMDRLETSIELNENVSIKLPYNDDLSVDYDQVEKDIFEQVVKSSNPHLTLDDVEITYQTKDKTGINTQYVSLKGGKVGVFEYPAISEGTKTIRISYKGNKDYKPATVETSIQVVDRPAVEVVQNEGPYNVSMKFNKDQSYDYEETAKAIYEAVIQSTTPKLSYEDFKIEYNADPTHIVNKWYALDNNDSTNLNKFKAGQWQIRLSWNGTKEYKGGSIIAEVNIEDHRIESLVALKDGSSITYNMDAEEMKKQLFESAIDFDNSTLPSKEELSVDDFTYEYYGENLLTDNMSGGVKNWAPVEGGKVMLLNYPQMPAGEQKIRITYKGNSDYRPSTSAEGTTTVNKAKVSVKVHSTNIFSDEKVPDGFITTNPADKFDVYTIYAGATSNVNIGLYLDLPVRYTNSTFLKVLDPVVEKISGKSLTQMMQDGVTVGELRKLFSTQELLDLLNKWNIDTGTFGQILTIINKLPNIADDVRVGFGTPNRAGLYTVTAVTDNKNYETGIGVGALLVKMHSKGVKLSWNQRFTDGKISQEEAKTFDFKATLSYDGDVSISQENVHYLYTGVTSKLKPYVSTTTPPTEPGRYTMTVVTLGGNYQAAPITRGWKITK